MTGIDEMDETLTADTAEAAGTPEAAEAEQAPWSPFPVSGERYESDGGFDWTVLRFPSRGALDQCVEALEAAAARTLGPHRDSFLKLTASWRHRADVIDRHEADFGRFYTEEWAPCATSIMTDDAGRLLTYLIDMVLLLDAGAAFGGE